jgi:hypothetical protein
MQKTVLSNRRLHDAVFTLSFLATAAMRGARAIPQELAWIGRNILRQADSLWVRLGRSPRAQAVSIILSVLGLVGLFRPSVVQQTFNEFKIVLKVIFNLDKDGTNADDDSVRARGMNWEVRDGKAIERCASHPTPREDIEHGIPGGGRARSVSTAKTTTPSSIGVVVESERRHDVSAHGTFDKEAWSRMHPDYAPGSPLIYGESSTSLSHAKSRLGSGHMPGKTEVPTLSGNAQSRTPEVPEGDTPARLRTNDGDRNPVVCAGTSQDVGQTLVRQDIPEAKATTAREGSLVSGNAGAGRSTVNSPIPSGAGGHAGDDTPPIVPVAKGQLPDVASSEACVSGELARQVPDPEPTPSVPTPSNSTPFFIQSTEPIRAIEAWFDALQAIPQEAMDVLLTVRENSADQRIMGTASAHVKWPFPNPLRFKFSEALRGAPGGDYVLVWTFGNNVMGSIGPNSDSLLRASPIASEVRLVAEGDFGNPVQQDAAGSFADALLNSIHTTLAKPKGN